MNKEIIIPATVAGETNLIGYRIQDERSLKSGTVILIAEKGNGGHNGH